MEQFGEMPNRRDTEARGTFAKLWGNVLGPLFTGIAAAVSLRDEGLPGWVAIAVVALVVVVSLVLVWLPMTLAIEHAVRRSKSSRALRASWPRFATELEERAWMFDPRHAHSLAYLLNGFRQMPSTSEHTALMSRLQGDVASVNSADATLQALLPVARAAWPGDKCARAIVRAIETLLVFPTSSGRVTALDQLTAAPDDQKAIRGWLDRYTRSMEEYGRFARKENRAIGEQVYREHF